MESSFLLEVVIAVGGFIASMSVVKSQVSDMRETIKELEERIHSLPETYVSYIHFKETIELMREDHRELKQDIKTILAMLSK